MRSRSSFNYESLETRKMLSADLDAARNLVANGDFEDQQSTEFFAFANVDETNVQEIDFRTVNTRFSTFAQLDIVAGQLDSIAQDIATESGADYLVSFDLRGRPVGESDSPDTNDVEVFFGGESLGVFRGGDRWQTINVAASADGGSSRLEFREIGSGSDGRGILLDHVAVARVEQIDIINGSFEQVDTPLTGTVTAGDVPGFFGVPNFDSTPIGVTAVPDASDGSNVLNLNTEDNRRDVVFQNIRTEAGGRYFVTFDLRNVSETDNINELRVRWNDEFVDSFRTSADWQSHGVVVEADSGFSTLFFRDRVSVPGDGPQLDNIQVYRIGSIASDFVVDLNGLDDGLNFGTEQLEGMDAVVTPDNSALSFSNGNFLRSATIRVLDFDQTETLTADVAQTSITADFNQETGILRLVGRDTVANYQQILRNGITFSDTEQDPELERRLLVSVSDGTAISDRSEVIINVIPDNDPPVAFPTDDIIATIGETFSIPLGDSFNDPDTDLDEFTINVTAAGDSEVLGLALGSLPTQPNVLSNPTINDGNLEFTVFGYGAVDISIQLQDTPDAEATIDYRVEVPFETPTASVPDDFAPFSGQRQLSDVTPSLRNEIYSAAPELSIDTSLDYQAFIETSDGIIHVDLFESESPLTVNSFVNLAEDGFFDGLDFHRVIDDFVAQGGDPTGIGSGGPGYQFVDELDNGLEFTGVGQLAMANSGPNTNGSQFFFTLNDNPSFAGQHTIFGEIISGLDVLEDINITGGGATTQIIQRVTILVV